MNRRALFLDCALAAWLVVMAGLYLRQFGATGLSVLGHLLGLG